MEWHNRQVKKAVELLEEALKIDKSRENPCADDIASDLLNLANALHGAGDKAKSRKALQRYRAAIELLENEMRLDRSQNHGQPLPTEREQALALIQRREVIAKCFNGIGTVLEQQGNLHGALKDYRSCLDMLLKLQNHKHCDTKTRLSMQADCITRNIANVQSQFGELRLAETSLRKQLEAANTETVSLEQASLLRDLGVMKKQLGDLRPAQQMLQAALIMFKKLLPSPEQDSADIAAVLDNQAAIHLAPTNDLLLTQPPQRQIQSKQ